MTCKECVHYRLCRGANGSTELYDPTGEEPTSFRVEQDCDDFDGYEEMIKRYNEQCGNKKEVKEQLDEEEEKLAIWKYDLFPYMKIGKVKRKNADGTVEVYGYDGMCFKPVKIMHYDETLVNKFNEILEWHRKAEKEADRRTLLNLRVLLEFEIEEEEDD